MIGKSAKPRCFRNVNMHHLPVEYLANSKAWMTAAVWNKWLTAFDRSMVIAGRKVLLIVDNASSHHVPAYTLQAVKLAFLPPNATSLIQPCDQGIIQSFKVQYRCAILRRLILHLEGKMDVGDFKLTLKDAVNFSASAWAKVKQETIQHCFRHAGFCKETITDQSAQVQPGDEEYRNIFSYIQKHYPEHIDIVDVTPDLYAAVDEEIATCPIITDAEIVQHIREEQAVDADDTASVEGEDLPPRPPVLLRDALQSISTLRNFFVEKGLPDCHLDSIEEQVLTNILKPLRQTVITDYMSLE